MVTLVFSEVLDPEFTTIVVSDAARRPIPASVPAIDTATGTVTLHRPLSNGTYLVGYRVVSVDGHTVPGSYVFTVADPALPPATTAEGRAAAAPPGGGGVPAGVLIGLGAAGVVLTLTAIGFVVSGRRRVAIPD